EALLPPSLPTLAELIEQDSDPKKYQWMQADRRDERCVITRVYVTTVKPTARLLTPNGITLWVDADDVTPLPDLPRLEWPSSGDVPTVAEQENVTPDQQVNSSESPKSSLPHPEDVPAGEPWIAQHKDKEWIGCRNDPGTSLPWLLIRRDE